MSSPLPIVDEHATVVEAGVAEVWPVLLKTVDRTFSRGGASGYARAVGCDPATASGPRPLAVGSTVPGFRVVAAIPGTELMFEGRHRFSSYSLTFHLEPVGAGRSRLRAETRAAFPGPLGRLYRLLVIGSRGHAVLVQRLLSSINRESSRTP
jgi:hypothetical protein